AELKLGFDGDFGRAWGGISGLQLGLPNVWTEASRRGIGLDRVLGWMSSGPAAFAGLAGKGRIALGADADLVTFAPDAEFTVEPAALAHRNPVSAFAGARLRGVVTATWLRGRPVDDEPQGVLLERG